jgi:hypothetical protein
VAGNDSSSLLLVDAKKCLFGAQRALVSPIWAVFAIGSMSLGASGRQGLILTSNGH